jgi:hypothetical protein
MELPEVQQLRSKFTPEIVRQITWAIIDNGRSFFITVLTQQDFDGRGVVAFPQSFLAGVLENIRFCNPIQRGNFPNKWLSQPKQDHTSVPRGSAPATGGARNSPGGAGVHSVGIPSGGARQTPELGRRGSPQKRAYEGFGGNPPGGGIGGGGEGIAGHPPLPTPGTHKLLLS